MQSPKQGCSCFCIACTAAGRNALAIRSCLSQYIQTLIRALVSARRPRGLVQWPRLEHDMLPASRANGVGEQIHGVLMPCKGSPSTASVGRGEVTPSISARLQAPHGDLFASASERKIVVPRFHMGMRHFREARLLEAVPSGRRGGWCDG